MLLSVVGNPENRRVALFRAAVIRAGLPEPRVFGWREVLLSGAVPGPGSVVRIDSPGENAEVDRLLRTLGASASASVSVSVSDGGCSASGESASGGGSASGGSASGGGSVSGGVPVEHGEIAGLAHAHAGFGVALHRIAAGGGDLVNQPGDILTMSDKPRCHALLAAAGVPVPPALGPVHDYRGLREAMRAAHWDRVFVKPAHGSSASGVLALATAGRRIAATTSVEAAPDGRLFNNLRVRRYDDEPSIAAIVDRLGPDGLHVERWYPKAGLGGRVLDLRVVVTAGRPAHVVVRTSHSPMTNLHLGNARGDVAQVRAAAGERSWAAAMETCTQAAACFPGTLHAGVDLMFRAGWRDHAVAEVNAFGDLLPGVLADGQDTYDAQITALLNGWRAPAAALDGSRRGPGARRVPAAALLDGWRADA